ncbi:MAG TPA: hypothetical protein VIK18_06680 [Pirellulales bacterium]
MRAPTADGAVLIDPPLEQVASLLEANTACQGRCSFDVGGRPLGQLAAAARHALVEGALRYTSTYRDVGPAPASDRVLLAGHQPQLFHPGVWLKNFVLGQLAAAHQAAAVNLVIDSDTIKSASIRVPGGSLASPTVQSIAYDASGEAIPFEERPILDRAAFDSFGRRVTEFLAPVVHDPLVREFWPLVAARSRETNNLGACLSQARHQLEGDWGLNTLEFPQSQVCQLEPFHWFAGYVLANMPRVWSVYNDSLAEYRREYRIRSAHHPAADLARDDGWLETPLWLWDTGRSHRRRIFVRRLGGELLLSDRADFQARLPFVEGDVSRTAAALAELPGRGVRLRTRALLTTMFARLFLGNLFLHGIGGGKYDELTDRLIGRLFGFEPPAYLVLSGTLQLPVAHANITASDGRRVDQMLRELTFHPERSLDFDRAERGAELETARHWQAHKQQWIRTEPSRDNARRRAREIRAANEALQPLVQMRRDQLLAERRSIAEQLRAEAVWSSREFAFCLYPEKTLRDFLLAFRPALP